MNFEQWHDHYKPIKNWLRKDEDIEMFETYGEEVGIVLGVNRFDMNKVWTLVDGDEGMWITNGFHYVNRIGYFITEIPYEGKDEFFDVLYDSYEDDELDYIDKVSRLASATSEEEIEAIIAK
jgi:hypothetical protein